MELLWKIVSAVILALVEGITEFLPISSTGHMILVKELLDLDVPPGGVFEIFIQFGAILSICVIYFDYLWKVTKAVPFNPNARRFAFGLVLAFLPAAFLGVLLSDFITTYLFSKYVVAVSLVLGGFAILYIERLVKIPQYYSVEDFPLSLYLKIGLCQCLALVPGVSRSGATIMGSLLMKVGASAYSLYKHWNDLQSADFLVLGIGFVVAFITAFYVARMFLAFVANHGFGVFAWYRIFIGTLMLSYLITKEYILV
jgi:undecaprenyl-diphosphatase